MCFNKHPEHGFRQYYVLKDTSPHIITVIMINMHNYTQCRAHTYSHTLRVTRVYLLCASWCGGRTASGAACARDALH